MELVIGSRNYLQACNWVQSTSLSHCSQDTVMMSRHPTQLWHVFMGALLTNFQLLPPCLYQEYPFFPCKWLFCSSYAGNLRTRRNSQNPKEIPNSKESPCSVLDSFAVYEAGWAEGSAPSGCILYKREGKASKPDWFPLQWLKTSLLTYTSN